jgi:hypothetical protein
MKVTIILEDNTVYKDGQSYTNLDLSSIPSNVHALQFNNITNTGWIEFTDNEDGTKPQNESITSLPEWATTACVKWDEAKTAFDIAQLKAEESKIKVTNITNKPTV